MSDTINLSNFDSKVQLFMNDQYISSSIILFFIFYTCMIAPKLPASIVPLMNSQLFNLIFLILIGYLATKNYAIGIVASVAYLVTMNTVHKYEFNKQFPPQDLLQNAIEEGNTNAQIIVPTVTCGRQQLSPEQIEQIKQIQRQYEQEQQQPQQQQQQQHHQEDTVEQVLKNDNNINEKISNRNFLNLSCNDHDKQLNVDIVGNCTHLYNLDGLPLNL